ncbi:MAG: MarR family transcriptional regulator [Victivallaceae bacterium]|nr:MarR family transcriptional regulator [Victivallaceae bacterium]
MDKKITADCEYRLLCALRRIIRGVDIYSRKLNSRFGLTTPQLLCLHAIKGTEAATLSDLAKAVNLGGSTVNGIIDRLEDKNYVVRQRSTHDRRKVYLIMTEAGREVVRQAPSLLQDKLSSALAKLSPLEQLTITRALEQVVELMEVEKVDASPNLISAAEIEEKSKPV